MSTVAGPDVSRLPDLDGVDTSERALVDALVPRQRSRRWAGFVAFLAATLVAVIGLTMISGTVVPRLSATPNGWTAVRGQPVRFTFTLHNDGYRPATITAIGLNAAGLDQGRTDVHLPAHLAPDHDLTITATFTRLRCNLIKPNQYQAGITVTARGDFPFTRTITAPLHNHFTSPFQGMRTYSGTDPLQIGWPAGITQDACTPEEP